MKAYKERDELISEFKRMQRLYTREELPLKVADFVEAKYLRPKYMRMELKAPLTYKAQESRVRQVVLEFYGRSWAQIVGGRRYAHIVRARKVMILMLYVKAGMTCNQLARLLKCDHSSIVHHKKRLLQLMSKDEKLRKEVDKISKMI